jgi:myo-inositol-1(or 4)-monophosphatase
MTTTAGSHDQAAYARHLLDVATEAVQLVAADLRAAFRTRVDIGYKRDRHDPVTEYDRRAEEAIAELLTTKVPGSTVVGEEDGARSGSGDVTWYVDPIDGTANFAHGLAFFCTSVGAVVDGEVAAGAILDPVAGELFTADLTGAWRNGDPLRSVGVVNEADALLITSYPNARALQSGPGAALARFGTLVTDYGTVRRPGSAALSLCHVAAGWADAALGTSVSAWDVCAGQLVVRQAGGIYQAFGGQGWDQPGYVAHTSDLRAASLHDFVAQWPTEAAR